MSLVEQQAGMKNLIPCNESCGGDHPTYRWIQNDNEATIYFPVPLGTTPKNVDVRISTNSLHVGLKNAPPILAGKLYKPIKAEESMWSLEERKTIVVVLTKSNLKYEEWWPHICEGEPQIDMKTLRPPSKNLRDLDEGAQATVAKMMYDQEQKRKGLPSSDEEKVQEALRRAGPIPE